MERSAFQYHPQMYDEQPNDLQCVQVINNNQTEQLIKEEVSTRPSKQWYIKGIIEQHGVEQLIVAPSESILDLTVERFPAQWDLYRADWDLATRASRDWIRSDMSVLDAVVCAAKTSYPQLSNIKIHPVIIQAMLQKINKIESLDLDPIDNILSQVKKAFPQNSNQPLKQFMIAALSMLCSCCVIRSVKDLVKNRLQSCFKWHKNHNNCSKKSYLGQLYLIKLKQGMRACALCGNKREMETSTNFETVVLKIDLREHTQTSEYFKIHLKKFLPHLGLELVSATLSGCHNFVKLRCNYISKNK